jgi:transposase
MRAFEFLTEYKRTRNHLGHFAKQYRDGGKPEWYDKAVQLKTDNPHITATEIGRQVKVTTHAVLRWLTGVPDSKGNIYNDNPPFTQKVFPMIGGKKYFDGEKPWWYEEAVAMRKQGMMNKDIANKLKVPLSIIPKWLVKGAKSGNGNLINPDAPFKPRSYNTKKIDTALLKELIVDKYTDEQIIELIADEKGDKIANQVRAMLPKLRQALQPGTSVIDKTRTGNMKDPDISGLITEVDDQFEAPVGDCFEAAYKKLYEVFREHPEAKLVHAIVTGQGPIKGVQHGHAWVEIGDTVLDYSNGRTIEMPKQIYYAVGNIDPSNSDEYKTYSYKEMADISMDQGTYGPWELPKGSL